jgi:hypothetical protein
MKTFFLSVVLIVCGWVFYNVSLFVVNIAGFPGALVAWGTSAYKERQSLTGHLRFALGVIVSLIGQSYVYLAWVVLIVNFTRHESPHVFAAVIWPVAFVASFFPVYFCAAAASNRSLVGTRRVERASDGSSSFSGGRNHRFLRLRVFSERDYARLAVGSLCVGLVRMALNGHFRYTAMISEILTAILVIITAIYAYLTHRMVKATEASVEGLAFRREFNG